MGGCHNPPAECSGTGFFIQDPERTIIELGRFCYWELGSEHPPSTDVADIAVSSSASANPITAGNQLTYTIQVTNNGPQIAHEVALRNGLSLDVSFASATSAHGSCKEIDGTIFAV